MGYNTTLEALRDMLRITKKPSPNCITYPHYVRCEQICEAEEAKGYKGK